MNRFLAACLLLVLGLHGAVAAPSEARPEIDALLARLQSSGCAFSRNGAWYDAAEARKHLQAKLDYLERRNLVQTTEQFIDRAASQSSVSGKAYLVRCGEAAPIESRAWLTRELKSLRAGASAK